MKRSNWAVALGTALCAVALAACGGGGSSAEAEQAAIEEAPLEFAECMRAHGVAVKDPKPGQNLVIDDTGNPATKKALEACNAKLAKAGGQELTPEEGEAFKEGWLEFARCMREEGIEMGDPTFLGPGKMHLDIVGLDTDSPAFKAAQEACSDKAPELDGVGVGG